MGEFSSYSSVFSWRYGGKPMRELFGEKKTRLLWRKAWVSLARAQKEAGLVSSEDLREIEKHSDEVDIEKAHLIERDIKHDLMAELRVFCAQAGKAGGKLHLGATSMDIEDNADALRTRKAIRIIREGAFHLLASFEKQINRYADLECMALTHLQTAEPTTVGYRFCFYAQDLMIDLAQLDLAYSFAKGKGFKGAVGTAASYASLLKGKKMTAEELEAAAMADFGLPAFEVSSQVSPRKVDFMVLNSLAGIAATLHKFAFDVRFLQSPYVFEAMEPFAEMQVGSSAMPFKRNPVKSERVCSLARFVSALPAVAWHNAANSLLERTLDDSANRRIIIPEGFLATDEALRLSAEISGGLYLNKAAIERNYDMFSPFAFTEPLLMKLSEKGADRQEMHEVLRKLSLQAWQEVQKGRPNTLAQLAKESKAIRKRLSEAEINAAFSGSHSGLAQKKCRDYSKVIRKALEGKSVPRPERVEF
ncbi:MAG: adenylosuccinate lyase [Candidatus Micrarchaeota archaeon]